jgi:hypothetical protein
MMSLSIIGSGRIVEEHIKAALLCNIRIRYLFSSRVASKNAIRLCKKYKIENVATFKEFIFLSTKSKSNFLIAGMIKKNSFYLKECIKTKKKIFIEKPVFLKSKNFQKYLRSSDQIFVGFNRIFYKNINFLKSLVSKSKHLTINCFCPELNRTRIVSNSSHIISILFFLFKEIKLIYKDKKKESIFLRYKLSNSNIVNIFINYKAIANFKIEIISKNIFIELPSVEELNIYNNLKKIKYNNSNIYKLKCSYSASEYNFNNIKPGIFFQMQEFNKFCQGKKIINNLKFAQRIIEICEKIVE